GRGEEQAVVECHLFLNEQTQRLRGRWRGVRAGAAQRLIDVPHPGPELAPAHARAFVRGVQIVAADRGLEVHRRARLPRARAGELRAELAVVRVVFPVAALPLRGEVSALVQEAV